MQKNNLLFLSAILIVGLIAGIFLQDSMTGNFSFKRLIPVKTEICNNGIDDNRDGYTDCKDRKCITTDYCIPKKSAVANQTTTSPSPTVTCPLSRTALNLIAGDSTTNSITVGQYTITLLSTTDSIEAQVRVLGPSGSQIENIGQGQTKTFNNVGINPVKIKAYNMIAVGSSVMPDATLDINVECAPTSSQTIQPQIMINLTTKSLYATNNTLLKTNAKVLAITFNPDTEIIINGERTNSLYLTLKNYYYLQIYRKSNNETRAIFVSEYNLF